MTENPRDDIYKDPMMIEEGLIQWVKSIRVKGAKLHDIPEGQYLFAVDIEDHDIWVHLYRQLSVDEVAQIKEKSDALMREMVFHKPGQIR